MSTIDKIIEELKIKGLSQKDLTDYLGVDKSTFSQWKKGSNRSYKKYIYEIADFLGVSIYYLISEERIQAAIKKFGFCINANERENIKALARQRRASGELNNEEIIRTFLDEWSALFSRSLENSEFSLNHVDFPTYISMLLNQDCWMQECSNAGVYDELVKQYGIREGIPAGSYYQVKQETVPKSMNARTLPPQMYTCKHYHSVSAGMGTSVEERCDQYGYWFTSQAQADRCFAVDVEGDSMEPELHEGDVAIVDTEEEPRDDDTVVIYDKTDETGYIKKYRKTDNCIMFVSVNTQYAPMIFPLSEFADRIIIHGKVVAVIREY